jgi:hypothetical protein
MKAIAVMTMLFLPATFFAALFAMPSLKWDEPGVIQGSFGVYWAFVLPTTAVIFVAWAGIAQRDWIMARLNNSKA